VIRPLIKFRPSVQLFNYIRKCALTLKKSYEVNHFVIRYYNVIKAQDAERILGSTKHIDKSVIYVIMQAFLKTGLVTSTGAKWHARRKLLTPAFHFNILKDSFHVLQ